MENLHLHPSSLARAESRCASLIEEFFRSKERAIETLTAFRNNLRILSSQPGAAHLSELLEPVDWGIRELQGMTPGWARSSERAKLYAAMMQLILSEIEEKILRAEKQCCVEAER